MKRLHHISVALLVAALPAIGQITNGINPEKLTNNQATVVEPLDERMSPKELASFLKKRTASRMVGTFRNFTFLLDSIDHISILSNADQNVPLSSPFLENYRPTWKEFMDVLARQVKCSWRYDYDTGYWVIERKKMAQPYELKIAKGWKFRDDGDCIVYIPPVAPVGMDVYMMGHYSSDDPAKLPEIFANARKHVATIFARNFKPDLSEKDFSTEKVCGETALFFSAPSPKDPKLKWRQWVFVKNGWCFIIVSSISQENESRLFKDVKKMIASFKVSDKN